MQDGRVVAVLFFASHRGVTMRAGGRMTPELQTKILWSIQGAGGDPLVLRGHEPSGRTFTQRVTGIGGGQYPSIVVVPSKGCWTLTATVAGQAAGSITVPVIAALKTRK